MPEMPKMPNMIMDASALEAQLRSAGDQHRQRQEMNHTPPPPEDSLRRPTAPNGEDYGDDERMTSHDALYPGMGGRSDSPGDTSLDPARDRPSPPSDVRKPDTKLKPTKTNFADIWAQTGLPDDTAQDGPSSDLESSWNATYEGPSADPNSQYHDSHSKRQPGDGTRSPQLDVQAFANYYRRRGDRPPGSDPAHLRGRRFDEAPAGDYMALKDGEDFKRRTNNFKQSSFLNEIPKGYTVEQVKWLATQRNVGVETVIQYLRQKQMSQLKEEHANSVMTNTANMVAMRQIAANAYERKMESLWKKHNMALRRRYLQNYSNYFQQLRNKARSMVNYQDSDALNSMPSAYSQKVREQLMEMQRHQRYDVGIGSPTSALSPRMTGTQSPSYGSSRTNPMAAQMGGITTPPRSQVSSPINGQSQQQMLLNRMAQAQLAQGSRATNPAQTQYQRQLYNQLFQQQYHRDQAASPMYGSRTPPMARPTSGDPATYNT